MFEVYPVVNGQGIVKFAWQNTAGNYLAITGSVIIYKMYNNTATLDTLYIRRKTDFRYRSLNC